MSEPIDFSQYRADQFLRSGNCHGLFAGHSLAIRLRSCWDSAAEPGLMPHAEDLFLSDFHDILQHLVLLEILGRDLETGDGRAWTINHIGWYLANLVPPRVWSGRVSAAAVAEATAGKVPVIRQSVPDWSGRGGIFLPWANSAGQVVTVMAAMWDCDQG